jgi:hypothetical protein
MNCPRCGVSVKDHPAGRCLDAWIAEVVFGLKEGVDFGVFPTHDWKLDEQGEIDTCAWTNDFHMGPQCQRCNESPCCLCQGYEDTLKEPCEVDPRSYSTWDLAAWDLVKKLNAKDWDVILTVVPQPREGTCVLNRCTPEEHRWTGAHGIDWKLALGRAALGAKADVD